MGKVPSPLSAKVEGSFAYFTVKDRLPVILTRVIDHLCRQKQLICKDYGQEAAEEIKAVVGQLSQLKNEMQTNKPFIHLSKISESSTNTVDNGTWTKVLQSFKKEFGEDPKWFTSSWLLAECYLYARINESFACRHLLNCYDPFRHQKIEACQSALNTIKILSRHVMKDVMGTSTMKLEDKKDIIFKMLQVTLWGNQCDLSLSGGSSISCDKDPFAHLEELSENIICSEEEAFWDYLTRVPEDRRDIGIILDNAGLELFADLCLATALIKLNLATSVTFYTKTIPWFVSDTTLSDLNWTLAYLRDQEGDVAKLSVVFDSFLEDETWKVKESSFWTGPHDFSSMKKEDPHLYKELSQYSLIIFKGDLNYRKLVGDLDWPNGTPFHTALRGFLPTSLLVLRTIKGGPVVGLDLPSAKVQNAKTNDDWFATGEFGLIQFVSSSFSLKSFHTLIISSLIILLLSTLLRYFL